MNLTQMQSTPLREAHCQHKLYAEHGRYQALERRDWRVARNTKRPLELNFPSGVLAQRRTPYP